MKKMILASGLLALYVIPAHAQIDWVRTRADSRRFEVQLENTRQRSHSGNKKRNSRKNRTIKQKTAAPKKVVERYPQVRVNGQLLKSAVPATEINGRTFVPFRDIFEALGATVAYDEQKRLITARRGVSQMELLLPRGDTAGMEGRRQSFKNDESPFVRNGATMVPLRMVSEMMGDKVQYTPHQKVPQISIISRNST